MPRSIYLINPRENFPTYHGTEVFESLNLERASLIADLTMTTVAALIPDDFEISLCDEHICEADLETPAEVIAITGKSTQGDRMITLAQEYKARGKIVMMGGPYVSLSPEKFRPFCDIMVIGEAEEIAEKMYSDIRNGYWQSEYIGTKPDMRTSPIPRWNLYPNDRALMGSVQTSRGCPFSCEFCDVIQYVGQKQRHKSIEQVINELDALYNYGYRKVFLADDNFTAFRHRSKELLKALRDWNQIQTEGRMFFATQLSIDTAKDTEILQLLSEAGPFDVFIGLETPNEDSLLETGKKQNLGVNLVDQIQKFFDYGIGITGGMIVGFDHDHIDIFQKQYEFAMSTSIPIFTLGALIAPISTPLFEKMKKENRLSKNELVGANTEPWNTNIIPLNMSREELFIGMRWLANRLYHPFAFGDRLLGFIKQLGEPDFFSKENSFNKIRKLSNLQANVVKVIRNIANLGQYEAEMMSQIMKALSQKPIARPYVMSILFQYAQIRYMYEKGDFWESSWIEDQPELKSVL